MRCAAETKGASGPNRNRSRDQQNDTKARVRRSASRVAVQPGTRPSIEVRRHHQRLSKDWPRRRTRRTSVTARYLYGRRGRSNHAPNIRARNTASVQPLNAAMEAGRVAAIMTTDRSLAVCTKLWVSLRLVDAFLAGARNFADGPGVDLDAGAYTPRWPQKWQ